MSSSTKPNNTPVHHTVLKGLFRTLVPHADNRYHPHLIRPIGLAIVLVIVIAMNVLSDTSEVSSVEGVVSSSPSDFSRQQLLTASNDARQSNDVALLSLNDDLSAAANLKARDMLVRQYWDHNAPDGTTPWYWFREVNYRYDFAGENLAKGFRSPSGVIAAWMESEEHRKNALNGDYQEVGFGVAEGMLDDEQTTVVVALYGSPVGSPALAKSEVLAASDGDTSLITRFGIGLQSLKPAVIGSIVLLLVVVAVALAAHAFRKRLPSTWQKGWRRHHGLYKAILTASLIFVLITLYGDGQIL